MRGGVLFIIRIEDTMLFLEQEIDIASDAARFIEAVDLYENTLVVLTHAISDTAVPDRLYRFSRTLRESGRKGNKYHHPHCSDTMLIWLYSMTRCYWRPVKSYFSTLPTVQACGPSPRNTA